MKIRTFGLEDSIGFGIESESGKKYRVWIESESRVRVRVHSPVLDYFHTGSQLLNEQ